MVPTDPRYHVPATSCRPAVTFPSESIDAACPVFPSGSCFRRCIQVRVSIATPPGVMVRFATPQLVPALRGYSPRTGPFLSVSF